MSAPSSSQPQPKIGWIFGILLALAIFAGVGAYSSRMSHDGTDYDRDRVAQRYDNLKKLRETDQQLLTTADWVDQAKGTVRIPIDEAMVQEILARKSKPAVIGSPIATLPPPAPPAAATNAAPAGTITNAAPAPAAPPAQEKK